MTQDLTTGSPLKTILTFGIPIILGNLLQQLYNAADAAIVGQFVGFEQLGAVGATSSLNFLVIGLVNGLCTGFSINIAQAFGAHDENRIKKLFINSIWLAVGLSILLTTLTEVFLVDILTLMNTPEDIFQYSRLYIGTIFAGLAGTFLYNLLANVLRALGDSKTPLLFLIISAILNIGLNLLFVLGFGLGVFGTALATVISHTFSGLCCIVLIVKKYTILRCSREYYRPDFKVMQALFSNGLPMGLQFSITAVGSIILQSAVNGLGTTVVASVTTATRIQSFFSQGLDGMGASIASFVGQNTGAQKYDRIKKSVRDCTIAGFIYSAAVFGLILILNPYIYYIFIDSTNTEAVALVHLLTLLNVSGFIFRTFLMVYRNTIQGMGYSKLSMFAGIFELVARCFSALLVQHFGVVGAGLASPLAWLAADIFLVISYYRVIRHTPQY